MRGYLKGAGVIRQCTRCYALRNLAEEPAGCPSCRSLLNEHTTTTMPLPFGDVSSDSKPFVSEDMRFMVLDRDRVKAAHA